MTCSDARLLRSSLSLSFAGLLAGLLASACDLPDKNLGDDAGGASGSSSGDGSCVPGDEPADCNTCSCMDGEWVCTAIACVDTEGADSGGGTCDPAEDPSDECNTCSCVDGQWLCTAIGCDPTGAGTCDPAENPTNGCNTCSCEDGEWVCTEEVCQEEPPVAICGPDAPLDPIVITDASIAGDTLMVAVQHGGGCVTHGYGTCWDGSFAESDPVQAWLQLSHEDNDDPCDAIVMQELVFDLTPMRDAWIDAYMQASGTIVVHVDEWGSLDYTF